MNDRNSLKTFLFWLQILLFITGMGLSIFSKFQDEAAKWSAEYLGLLALALTLAAAFARIQLQLDTVSQRSGSLESMKGEIKKLGVKNERGKVLTSISEFLDPSSKLLNVREPHLHAYVLTGKSHLLRHTDELSLNLKTLQKGLAVTVQDVSFISIFLRNIVEVLDDLEVPCVWMGTSRVTKSEAWTMDNEPLFSFAESIRSKAVGEDLFVYRVYEFEESHQGIEAQVLGLYQKHVKGEPEITARLRVSSERAQDISLICVPKSRVTFSGQTRLAEEINPGLRWSEFKDSGWEVLCGIDWSIVGSRAVRSAKVYSGKDIDRVGQKYLRIHRSWEQGIGTPVDQAKVRKHIDGLRQG